MRSFHKNLAKTSPNPFSIEVDYANGSYIYDKNGKKYLDLISGIGVSFLGHSHPRIIEAIKVQSEKYLHTMVYGEFIQEPQNKLADELANSLPKELDSFYFLNSGTEAIEAALKLAKRVSGKSKIISFEGSYHGNTHGSMSVSDNEYRKNSFRPLLPDVHFLEWNNSKEIDKIDFKTACVVLETVQGDAGVRIPDIAFMQELRKRCTEVGALLILDEIQCGVGRTGKMWAFEHFNIVPDILTAGKALGGGLPFGCLIASKKLMSQFEHAPMLGHITTFGGHPLPCSSAFTALRVIKDENLLETVNEKSELFKKLLLHPKIIEVRIIGLMLAIELKDDEAVRKVVLEGLNEGVILFWFLSTPNAFRISPPLNISEKEIKTACEKIIQLIDLT